MNDDQSMPNEVTRAASPFVPDARIPEDDLAGHQASWPTVIGVISIIYALLGIFANGCGTAFIYLGGQTLALMGLDAGDLQLPMWLKIVQTVMGLFGVGLGILLLAGAIGLIRRKIASLGVLKIWAVLAILSTFVGIGIGFAAITPNVQLQLDIQEAIRDKMKSDGGDPSQIPELNKDEETMRSESIRNLAIVGALPIIYPAIIGFLVSSRKRLDQAETWGDDAPVA